MGYKCGNCGVEFGTKKEWLDHIADVHNSYFLEGDEKDVSYHEKKIRSKAEQGNIKAQEMLRAKEL